MACGNGSDRTQHPIEFFGRGWQTWNEEQRQESPSDSA
jgi:hypothetical protein